MCIIDIFQVWLILLISTQSCVFIIGLLHDYMYTIARIPVVYCSVDI